MAIKKKLLMPSFFFDEFDKLFMDKQNKTLQSYHNLLIAELLTIIEGSAGFPVDDKGEVIDSKKMLFILGGSFGMHEQSKHEKINPIGFHETPVAPEEKGVSNQLGLTEFGLPDELAGRIGGVIKMQSLGNEQMIEVFFNSPTSPIKALNHRLSLVDCTLQIETGLIKQLIDDNADLIKKFGVRGIYQAFYQLPAVNQILFSAPEQSGTTYRLSCDGYEIVDDDEPDDSDDIDAIYSSITYAKKDQTAALRQQWVSDVMQLNNTALSIKEELDNLEKIEFEEFQLLIARYELWEMLYEECINTHAYASHVTLADLAIIDTSIKEQWATLCKQATEEKIPF